MNYLPKKPERQEITTIQAFSMPGNKIRV